MPIIKNMVPIDFLRKHYTYSAEKGEIYSNRTGEIKKVGTNKKYPSGYAAIYIKGNVYLLFHRAIWALHFGEWPKGELDHINGDRADNRISNLREATRGQNGSNRGKSRANKTGYKGVFKMPNGRFRAAIQHQNKKYHLGEFGTAIEAYEAYCESATKLHGEFAHG